MASRRLLRPTELDLADTAHTRNRPVDLELAQGLRNIGVAAVTELVRVRAAVVLRRNDQPREVAEALGLTDLYDRSLSELYALLVKELTGGQL